MKKSTSVPATLLSAIAAATLAGCSSGPREVRRCVDEKGRYMEDYKCTDNRYRSHYYGYPRFVYGGNFDNRSGRVMGFRSTPSDGAHVVTPSGRTISRGGFGGSGRSGGGFSFGG